MTAESPEFAQYLAALNGLLDSIANLVQSEGGLPKHPSPAAMVAGMSEVEESARTAFSQALILMEVAADHGWALVTTLAKPAMTVAPYTCARVAIETSALAKWLLDPWPDLESILKRSIALRFNEVLEQSKLVKAVRADGTVELESTLDRIVERAEARGYEIIWNKRGRRIGVGTPMPAATRLVKETLDQEFAYRLLSAAAHGQTWALRHLSFSENADQRTDAQAAGFGAAFEKTASPIAIRFIATAVSRAVGDVAWQLFMYSAWSMDELAVVLDRTFESLEVREDLWFWRSSG